MEKKYLTLKEKICFPLSAFGRSGIYTIMTMFYLVFLVDVAKLNAVTASAIILGGRIFDALNDPIMGMIVDKTRSKWGKNASVFAFLSDTGLCVDHPFVYCSFSKQRGGYCICCVYICALGCLLYDTRRSFLGTDFGYNTKRKRTYTVYFKRTFGFYIWRYSSGTSYSILRQSSLGLRGGYLFGAILFWCHGRASFKSCVLYY